MADCCKPLDTKFDRRSAEKQLRQLRRNGPSRETRLLIDALVEAGVGGATLLDIGGGPGAVQAGLFEAGAQRATSVDASAGYLEVARAFAAESGFGDRVDYRHGDFVALADDIPVADVVTLDKVICCYPDMRALVGRSAASAGRLYGAVYPRDSMPARLSVRLANAWSRLTGSEFRVFVHPEREIDGVLRERGFARRSSQRTLTWRIVVWERNAAAAHG